MKQNKMERTLPRDQRPYEKCREKGERALTDAELLAIVLRTGTADESALELASHVMRACPARSGLSGLCEMSTEELMQLKGIGSVKAMQLKCICELARRLAKETSGSSQLFDSPQKIAAYYMEDMRHLDQEELKLLFLNARLRLIDDMVISRGTVNASMITPREIYLEALRHHAVSIVLLHNHPSGEPSPSEDDLQFTERVRQAGEMLGVSLLDHIIIGDAEYCSLKERGSLK